MILHFQFELRAKNYDEKKMKGRIFQVAFSLGKKPLNYLLLRGEEDQIALGNKIPNV